MIIKIWDETQFKWQEPICQIGLQYNKHDAPGSNVSCRYNLKSKCFDKNKWTLARSLFKAALVVLFKG